MKGVPQTQACRRAALSPRGVGLCHLGLCLHRCGRRRADRRRRHLAACAPRDLSGHGRPTEEHPCFLLLTSDARSYLSTVVLRLGCYRAARILACRSDDSLQDCGAHVTLRLVGTYTARGTTISAAAQPQRPRWAPHRTHAPPRAPVSDASHHSPRAARRRAGYERARPDRAARAPTTCYAF